MRSYIKFQLHEDTVHDTQLANMGE